MPIGERKKKREKWGWSDEPGRYPILTRRGRRDIVYGENDAKHRLRAEIDEPFETLEKEGDILIARCVYDQRRHEEGWRIVPSEVASDKLREKLAEQRNRGIRAT